MNKKELPQFTPTVNILISHYGKRNILACLVFGQVWCYSNMQDGVCKASIPTMAKNLSCNYDTVLNWLKVLVNDGFIVDLTPDKDRSAHEYIVTDKIWELKSTPTIGVDGSTPTNGVEDKLLQPTGQTTPMVRESTPTVRETTPMVGDEYRNINNIENIEKIKKITIDKHSAKTAEYLSDLPSRSDILHSKNSTDILNAEESSIPEDHKSLELPNGNSTDSLKQEMVVNEDLSSGKTLDAVGSGNNSEKTPETEEIKREC